MPDPLDVGEVAALLLDERKYDQPPTRKEFHKLMYFAAKELQDVDVEAEVPYFWYKFGTMTPTTHNTISIQHEGHSSAVRCSVTPKQLNLADDQAARARLAVSRVLNQHYKLGTEGLTDKMYDDAPYEVQRRYRELDKQLGALAGIRNDVEIDTSREAIRENLFDFVDAFPVDEFPQLRSDLFRWYDVMSAELDTHDFSANHMLEVAEAFWTIFSVKLAQRANTGVTKSEIVSTLGTDEENFHEYAEEMRQRIQMWDRDRTRLQSESTDNDEVVEAVEAVVTSHPEIPTP